MSRLRRGGGPALVALVAAATLASCAGSGDDGRSVVVDGAAIVTAGGKRSTLGPGRHRVARDATLRVTRGTAVLDLAGDASTELQAGSEGTPDSIVRIADVPVLLGGEALVVSGRRATLRAGDVEVVLEAGAARVRQSTSTTVGVYRGRARLDARGRVVQVRALRQLTVAGAAAVPRTRIPLVYDQAVPDRWDRRYLGEAIDSGRLLDRMSQALTRQFDRTVPTAAYLATLLPALGRRSGAESDLASGERAVGETMVGASIALEGPPPAFSSRLRDVFGFRAAGARWGLVAFDQQAARSAVVGRLDAALNRLPTRFTRAPAPGTTTTNPPAGAGPGRPPTSTTPLLPTPTPGPAPVPTPTVPRLPILPGPSAPTPGQRGPTTTTPPALPIVPTPTVPPTTLPIVVPTPPGSGPPVPPASLLPLLQPLLQPVQDLLDGILRR